MNVADARFAVIYDPAQLTKSSIARRPCGCLRCRARDAYAVKVRAMTIDTSECAARGFGWRRATACSKVRAEKDGRAHETLGVHLLVFVH